MPAAPQQTNQTPPWWQAYASQQNPQANQGPQSPFFSPSKQTGGGGFNPFAYDQKSGFFQRQTIKPKAGGGVTSEWSTERDAPPWGQLLQQVGMHDYRNLLGGQQEMKGRMEGLAGGMLQGAQQGAGAMVQRGMQDADRADQLGAGAKGWAPAVEESWKQTREGADADFTEARNFLKGSYDTMHQRQLGAEQGMRGAIDQADFGRQDVIAASVSGAASSLRDEMTRINSDPNIDPAQRAALTAEAKRRTQTAIAQQVPQLQMQQEQARLEAETAMSQLQSANATNLGQTGLGTGQALAGIAAMEAELGAKAGAEVQRAREASAQFQGAMTQYSSSLRQQSLAAGTQFLVQGFNQAFDMVERMPLSAPSLMSSILAGLNAADLNVSQGTPNPEFARMLLGGNG